MTGRGAVSATGPRRFAGGTLVPAHPAGDGFAGLLAHCSKLSWLLGLLLVMGTVLAYRPAWHGEFFWDDDVHIANNRMLSEPGGWKQIWTSPDSPQYYPLVFTSFRLERGLWGLNPTGYHWVNLLLHAASAVLVWRVLRRLKVPGSWLAAAVFALHPVNVESVAWISQRKNTLAMFFYMLSLLLYLRFDPAPRPSTLAPRPSGSPQPSTLNPQPLWYWLSLAAFVLALLSKTAVSPLPLVLLGLAWWQRGRVTSRDVWRSAPFFIASLVLGLVTVGFERHQTAFQIVRDDSFWSRLAAAGWAVWFYLYKALLPLNLIVVYPRWHVDPSQALAYVPGVLVVGAFVLLWRYRRRWGRAWLFCAGYYVVMLLPVLGFVNIGFMSYSLVADHWQYFAIIAPIAVVSAGLTTGFTRAGKEAAWLGAVLGGALLLALGGLTWRQSGLYANAETLWQATLTAIRAVGRPITTSAPLFFGREEWTQPSPSDQAALQFKPDYADAHNNLGTALLQKGAVDEAIAHYQRALQILPHFAAAHNNLGIALVQKGRVGEALAQYREALRILPNYAEAYNDLGIALVQEGEVDAAIAQYQKALQIRSDFATAHNNLGLALVQKGAVDQAIAQYQSALQSAPEYAEAHINLGAALDQKGRVAEAISHFQQALQIEPANPKAQNKLAWLLATGADASLRNGSQAVELAWQANERTGGTDLVILRTLAAAFAEAGRFSDAVGTAQRALELAQTAGQADFAAQLNDQLQRYKAGLPLHQ